LTWSPPWTGEKTGKNEKCPWEDKRGTMVGRRIKKQPCVLAGTPPPRRATVYIGGFPTRKRTKKGLLGTRLDKSKKVRRGFVSTKHPEPLRAFIPPYGLCELPLINGLKNRY